MAKVHLFTRTVIPRHKAESERELLNSALKTYFLSEQELAYYKSLPVKKTERAIVPVRRTPATGTSASAD